MVEFLDISTLQSVLVLALGHAATDLDRRRILQKHFDAGHLGHFLAQLLNHSVGIQRSLLPRLQPHHQPPGIPHGSEPGGTRCRHESLDLRFLTDHIGNGLLVVDHGLERDALRCFGRTRDLAGILTRAQNPWE